MPTISVKRDELYEALGRTYTEKEFYDLCFEFGIELDEVTSEKTMIKAEQGRVAEDASDEILYKIEVPANRYDLLCLEGLARALRIFLQLEEVPEYKAVVPAQPEKIVVHPEVASVRPVVVCAILRNLAFTPSSYASFIELQEKLHQNICRKRSLVSIGTHDYDTIKGPFTYEARKPEDIRFVPLNCSEEVDGHQLMQQLADTHLKPYLNLIKDEPLYPVIYDSNGVLLSLPPIINGEHSKIRMDTKNVFIEVTATDLTKAKIVLNTMVTMFSQYCEDKFVTECVHTVDADGSTSLYPDLTPHEVCASVDYINGCIGVQIDAQQVVALLNRMSLRSDLSADGKEARVLVPPTRSDILHACDVMEDVAIAYGYNNLKLTVPATTTVAKQQPINKFSDLLRLDMAQCGYAEAFTLSLCSAAENFELLNRPDDGTAVKIANPKTAEFQVGRTTLLVGLLKTIQHNKDQPLPVRLFEISDVLLKDEASDVGAINRRRLCAVYYNTNSGFEIIQGLVDRVMLLLDIKPERGSGYHIQPCDDEAFFPGRRADIIWQGQKVGVFGILHPNVVKNFELVYPCSAVELELEPFLAHKLRRRETRPDADE